LYVDLPL
ncbi:phage minor tail protein L, partial [Escherichia coli 3.4870]